MTGKPEMRIQTDRDSHHRRHGTAAAIAMIYLVLISGVAVVTFYVSTLATQGAVATGDLQQARALAESGIRWQASRLRLGALRPIISKGNLSSADADALWPEIRSRIAADWSGLTGTSLTVTQGSNFVEMSGLQVPSGVFRIRVERLPGYSVNPLSEDYRQFMRITSTGVVKVGTPNEVWRSASMSFTLDKRINFAVAGKTRMQLGRNTLVEGPIAMGTANKFSPYLILSDFDHFDSWLTAHVDAWHEFLKDNHQGYDNRISINDTIESEAAIAAGFSDYSGDNYIDEFDLFLQRYDSDGNKAISRGEFTGPDGLYEPNLWAVIDTLGAPLFDGDVTRSGYQDDIIDARDFYAKVTGTVSMLDSAQAWQQWLNSNGGGSIRDLILGPIVPQLPTESPVTFGASLEDMVDLNPASFEEAGDNFRLQSGTNAGSSSVQKRQAKDNGGAPLFKNGVPVMETALLENAVLSVNDASLFLDGSGNVSSVTQNEQTPYGSLSYQATYRRPVFRNVTLRNVTIPKGMNAMFEDCTFEGVTFIDMTRDIVVGGSVKTDSGSGMTWSKQMKSGSFNKSTPLTAQNSYGFERGNNIRFESCTFNGPLVNPYATAYTHFSNSWEFTGETLFDNESDDTATVVAPQTNIEMGSFERPGEAPSKLVGVVVAGNIDIRGVGIVDGSIIVTGDGAGNTTLGYFGASDSETDGEAMPEGGYGRLNVRYNPYRPLPDGIMIPVLFDPIPATYTEN